MDRVQFDSMEVLKQIDYINSQVKEGYTITKICERIGIGRTTVRDRFVKEGYIFNKLDNIYMKLNDKNITKVNYNEDTSYKNNTIVNNESDKRVQSIEDFNNIKNDLLELINSKDELLKMLKNYNNTTKIIDIPQLDINSLPGELQKDITNKSIKVYAPIYDLFDDLCKTYSSIKKQDVISLALYEFYKKYKK